MYDSPWPQTFGVRARHGQAGRCAAVAGGARVRRRSERAREHRPCQRRRPGHRAASSGDADHRPAVLRARESCMAVASLRRAGAGAPRVTTTNAPVTSIPKPAMAPAGTPAAAARCTPQSEHLAGRNKRELPQKSRRVEVPVVAILLIAESVRRYRVRWGQILASRFLVLLYA